jgi:hypothetical protein
MDYLSGITAYTPLAGISPSGTVSSAALTSGLDFLTSDALGSSSTFVELSGLGQLLSAAATFQDQLQSLQPGTATSGGGQNFGSDLASLAAESQSLVDAFNGLQSSIANINGTSGLLGGGVTGTSDLAQSLGALAQSNYGNGDSSLTNLSQLGITYTPSLIAGNGGSLSIDLATLQSAFNTDAAGAFSLLASAANALAGQAGSFVSEAGGQYSALAALTQTTSLTGSATSNLLSETQSGGLNFGNVLLSQSLNGNISLQQAILAMDEYSLVSSLFA